MRRYLLPDDISVTTVDTASDITSDAAYHGALQENRSNDEFFHLRLKGEEFHYLVHVLRYREGSEFEGIDRQGHLYRITVTDINHNSIGLDLVPVHKNNQNNSKTCASADNPPLEYRPTYYLFQSLLKGKKMDAVIRQATATGVHHIVPLITEHTVAKIETSQREQKKLDRWKALVKEAVQQSGSRTIPQLHSAVELQKMKKSEFSPALGLFLHEEPLEKGSLHRYLSSCPQSIALFIGPEGGFSPGEVQFLSRMGCRPVHLQTNILRAETAAIYAIGAVQTIAGEIDQWKHVPQSPGTTDTAGFQ